MNHEVKVYPFPMISKVTPLIVLNEKMPPILEIHGSNLGWFQRVIFKHRQTQESQVMSANENMITVRLPSLIKIIDNPRGV
jgi:hypothetical protein